MVTGVKTGTGGTEEKSQLGSEKCDHFYGAGPQMYC